MRPGMGEEAMSAAIGALFLAAVAVVGIAGGYAFSELRSRPHAPAVYFLFDDTAGTAKVLSAPDGVPWADLNVTCAGAQAPEVPAGNVTSGQTIAGCAHAELDVVHAPTGKVVASHDFP